MSASEPKTTGPDFTLGVATDTIADGKMLAGHVGDDAVLLARRGNEFFAIGATCTHYGGPLAEGLLVGDTVRCPWHHACFSLRTGEAVAGAGAGPVSHAGATEMRDGKVFVREKAAPARRARPRPHPEDRAAIVIVGGGAAGFAAAEMLRREGYAGAIVMLSADAAPPVDRPNLSKDYLAGQRAGGLDPAARRRRSTREQRIDLRLGAVVTRDRHRCARGRARRRQQRRLRRAAARDRRRAGAAATARAGPAARAHAAHAGATAARSSRGAATARRAVVIGASFIGLEVAASLRARGLEVHVVAPDDAPDGARPRAGDRRLRAQRCTRSTA